MGERLEMINFQDTANIVLVHATIATLEMIGSADGLTLRRSDHADIRPVERQY